MHDDLAVGVQVMDRLLTRLGSSDCLETSSSSFLVEMQARPDVHFGGRSQGALTERDLPVC